MELIKKESTVDEGQKKLSKASANFLAFVEKNPWSLERSSYSDLFELNFDAGALQPWPVFIDQRSKNEIKEAGIRVFNLIRSIPERLFGNDVGKLSTYYNVPADIVKIYLEAWNGDYLKTLLGRGDFIFSPSGLKCIEYNVSGGLGGWQVALLEPIYMRTPAISTFLKEYRVKVRNKNLFESLFEHLLSTALDKFTWLKGDIEMNIAIVIPGFDEMMHSFGHVIGLANQIYETILSFSVRNNPLKGEVLFCDFHHLYIAGDCLFHRYKNKRIHVLVEMYHGEVPAEILDVFRLGNVLLYNGPITRIMSDKENLALLSMHQESDIFSPEEREVIRKYIPWTREVVAGETTYRTEKVKLEEFILSNKDNLVIKPVGGKAGEWVFIGRHNHKTQWKELIKIALRNGGWLVQEYIKSCSYLFLTVENRYAEHHAVWGLFVFGSRYAGGFLRVLPEKDPQGVINTHQGAKKTVILEVEE
jgi:hypothetical protein